MPHPEHGACVHSSRVIGPSTIGAVAEYGCRRMRDAAPWSVRAGSRPYPRCALREGAPHDSYLCAAPRQMGSGPDLDITVAATALCSGGTCLGPDGFAMVMVVPLSGQRGDASMSILQGRFTCRYRPNEGTIGTGGPCVGGAAGGGQPFSRRIRGAVPTPAGRRAGPYRSSAWTAGLPQSAFLMATSCPVPPEAANRLAEQQRRSCPKIACASSPLRPRPRKRSGRQ